MSDWGRLHPLKLLIVEDQEDDALLLSRHLVRLGFEVEHRRVDTVPSLAAALSEGGWQLVLCDYTLPSLTVFQALELVRQADADLPLIVVTGSMGEDELVRLIKLGAKDIVLKDNLARLKPAIDRELAEATRRRQGRETEFRLIEAIETVSEGIALFDANDRIVLRNQRYAQFFGPVAPMVVPGAGYETIVREAVATGHFETDGGAEAYVKEHTGEARVAAGQHEQPLSDGRWVRFREGRTRGEGTIAIVSDITERKQREERLRQQAVQLRQTNARLQREAELREATQASLRESESRLRSILDSAADAILTFDSTGAIESANLAGVRLFGRALPDLVGQSIMRLLPGICPDGVFTASELIGHVSQLEARGPNGEMTPVDIVVSEMRLDEKRMFTVLVRDVTERRRLDRMKGEFVSVVSHELRTPLTAIKGSLAVLQAAQIGEVSDRLKPMLDMAVRNAERLIKLINDILDIEKIELDKMNFVFRPVSLRPLVDAAIREYESVGAQAGVSLKMEKSGEDITVLADPDRLVQVLTNLLSNATKYSPRGETVSVALTRRGQVVQIAVSDRGDGVPDSVRDTIFEKFVQADSSDTRRRGGTGLGLSIARAIVERHGGRIGFSSKAGEGATFYFELPGWHVGADTSPRRALA